MLFMTLSSPVEHYREIGGNAISKYPFSALINIISPNCSKMHCLQTYFACIVMFVLDATICFVIYYKTTEIKMSSHFLPKL